MKKVATSNISAIMQPICFILSPDVWEDNGLLNKNYWDDLDFIDQGHILRVTFCNFAYISAILGPIFKKNRPQ